MSNRADFAAILDRARSEKWEELALVEPGYVWNARAILIERGLDDSRIFECREIDISLIVDCPSLRVLAVWGHGIGDDGAKAIAALTNLNSLYLNSNRIGPDGAKAIAASSKYAKNTEWTARTPRCSPRSNTTLAVSSTIQSILTATTRSSSGQTG